MILDNIKPGDYFIVERPRVFDENIDLKMVSGEPFLVRGVSLPWIASSPISKPQFITAWNLDHWVINLPSEEYVDAWRVAHWEVWHRHQLYVEHCNKVAKGEAKMPEPNPMPFPFPGLFPYGS